VTKWLGIGRRVFRSKFRWFGKAPVTASAMPGGAQVCPPPTMVDHIYPAAVVLSSRRLVFIFPADTSSKFFYSRTVHSESFRDRREARGSADRVYMQAS
jgi:hypothetical protein